MTISKGLVRRAAALLLATCAVTAAQADTQGQTLRFDVYFDDKRIGEHVFEIQRDADGQRVTSEARFEYRLLFVPVYRYRHEAQEVWRDGCLQRLTSVTDDNGRRVEVARLPDAAADCPASFAYWDRTQLERDALINAQTGEPVPARLVAQGEDAVDGEPARRYRLELDGMPDIELWYRAEDGAWLRLETRRESGTLTYQRRDAGTGGGPVLSAG
ncbi:MAG: DUF6134 family protein [Pseudomonadales bacterium]